MTRLTGNSYAAALVLATCFAHSASGEVIERGAKETLTALEMDCGDELRFSCNAAESSR